jgi:hypothetical protein
MANINQRLNGLHPLSYLGDNAVQPPDFVTKTRAPTATDSKNFALGDIWLDMSGYPGTLPTNEDIWMLVALVGNQATWVNFGGGDLETLTGDVGGPVSPDAADNINTLGTAGQILVTGNPGTNTLTWSLDGSVATQYTEDVGVAVPVAGNLNIVGGGGITTNGAGDTVTITDGGLSAQSFPTDSGTATPAAGVLNIIANVATLNCGSSVLFDAPGASNTVQLNVTDADANTIIGFNSGNLTFTGTNNTGLGEGVLASLTTASNCSAIGHTSLAALTSGSSNCCLGSNTMPVATTAASCVAVGVSALASNISSNQNIAIGGNTLTALATAAGNLGQNTAVGVAAMENATTAQQCVALGFQALGNILTGDHVIAIGESTGANYTGAESDNVLLGGVQGTVGESAVMRLGNDGSTAAAATAKTWIYGIRGVTTDVNDAIAVLIDSTGQLGTVSSSARYKENIEDMGAESNVLLKLRPVVFNYKKDASKAMQYGLIAEEVAVVAPRLAVYDEEGIPSTVKYHELPVLLLNELQKHCKMLDDRDKVMAELLDRVAILEERVIFGNK